MIPRGPASVGVVIEPMRRAHARAGASIVADGMSPPWSADVFRRELAQGDRRCYVVARTGRQIAGVAGLLLTIPGAEAHVTVIAVDPDRRGQGIGRMLLAHLAGVAIERGADAMTLEVRPSNEPAMALYRRFGFAPEGVRRNYYELEGEDALILWARDILSDAYATRLRSLEGSSDRSAAEASEVEPAYEASTGTPEDAASAGEPLDAYRVRLTDGILE